MNKFKIPPISTLIGSEFINYVRVIRQGRIQKKYYLKVFLSTLVILISTPFHLWEKFRFSRQLRQFKPEQPPLFIIGHWRSGTTFIHNILCQDPKAGYLTTFQSVFPNNLGSKLVFKNFMKWNMPDKRPSDNVKLNINYPQEDEFAMANSISEAYYNFFYFPENYEAYLKELRSGTYDSEWKKAFRTIVAKALLNTNGQRSVIKNPVNTFRIKQLLELYPDARFIYMYRNPITVFLSTQKFFQQLMPTLWFHEVSQSFIDEMILSVFSEMMESYDAERSMIPEKNLLEIRFEDFEAEPEKYLQQIYDELLEDDYGRVQEVQQDYLASLKGYKRNRYDVDKRIVDKVALRWKKHIELYGYDIPAEINLV